MDFLTLAIVFMFGAIIGSFLNVVIYRYNSGRSPLVGRSQCFSCGKVLRPWDLVPIVSFLVSRGRCAACKVRLSWQYPIVEAITGAMFVAVFLLGKSVPQTFLLAFIFSMLIVIAVYDLRHQIIPDGIVALFAILSLTKFFWSLNFDFYRALHFPYVWTLIAGPLLFFPFWALWTISSGRWLGLGDGKLALGIGWFLGATLGGSAIMLAFWIGALWALAFMGAQRFLKGLLKSTKSQLSMQSEIPFGPFLILGVFIVYFTGVNFFDGSVTFFTFL